LSGRSAEAASRPTSQAPDDQLLVVSNNVFDTDVADARHNGDMHRFAVRSLELVDYFPDVYLLQEIRKSSMNAILTKLNQLSPNAEAHYVAAVAAPKAPWRKISDKKLVGTDVAILINDVTMTRKAFGHIKTGYSLSQSLPGEPVKVKRAAYAVLEKANDLGATTVRSTAVSVHFPKWREFKNNHVSQDLKASWMKKIADKLDVLEANHQPGGADHKVIAGDTNNFKCDMFDGCPTSSPMYAHLTGRSYRDAFVSFNPTNNPIDFLLTSGLVAAGGVDPSWSPSEKKAGFYSNHNLRWGLFETVDATGPTAPQGIREAVADERAPKIRIQGWRGARDGGSGIDIYQVWRQHGTEAFELVATVEDEIDVPNQPTKFVDMNVTIGETYRYKVNAVDFVGNHGDFTSAVTCTVPSSGEVDCLN
jgi:hypothetical protein